MSRMSPPRTLGPLGPAIDNHTLPPLPLGEESWRLFSPSKAKSGSPKKSHMPSVPPPSPRYIGDYLLMSQGVERMEEVSRFVPQALNYQRATSDDSLPGLIDDYTGSSDSDTSSDEERYHNITDELFNSYLDSTSAPIKKLPPPRHPEIFDAPEILPSHAARYRAGNRYGADEQPFITVHKSVNDLHRARAQRNPTRAPATFLNSPPPLQRNHTSHHLQQQNHNTWPLRTPIPAAPLSLYPTSSQRGTYPRPPTADMLCHARSTPNFRGGDTLIVEKSAFDDDSDDEGDAKTSFADKLHHIRNLSNSSRGESSPPKPKRRSVRRSASDAIKDFFHVKK